VRILTKGGRKYADVAFDYIKGSDRFESVCAWLILPGGEVREFDSDDFSYMENVGVTHYSESWKAELDKSGEAVPGSVFAWSCTQIEPLDSQVGWTFGSEIPVQRSTLTIVVPKDWKVSGVPMNHPQMTTKTYFPQGEGRIAFTWEVADQPVVKPEPLADRKNVIPALGIDILPSEDDRTKAKLDLFENWRDVAAFGARTNDDSATPDAAIRAKVAELTKNCDTSWKKVQALCRYAQAVNYSAVGLNLRAGGGYRPFPASDVLAHNYGDCKGKTALLRAMLSCIGVKSYAVLCTWDEESDINPEWPTKGAFNHCITAIVPEDDWQAAAIAGHPQFGRLLLFDPTNKLVPVGFVYQAFGNEWYLVASPECKELAKFPIQEGTRWSELVARLDASGKFIGTFTEKTWGDPAAKQREKHGNSKPSDFERTLSEPIRKQSRAAKVDKCDVADKFDDNEFDVKETFEAPDYARRIGADKLLVKAFVDSTPQVVPNPPKNGVRETPFIVPKFKEETHSEIAIPEGCVVAELPKEITIHEDFGDLELHCVADGALVRLSVNRTQTGKVLPPEAYERFLNFCRARNTAFAATIVIAKK
jgi:hypothetical protein